MAIVNIYLNFEGNCEEAFSFYAEAFGETNVVWNRFADMPPSPEFPISEEMKQKIMHVSLPISSETVLMGSDVMPGMNPLQKGDNFSISVGVDSREEADALFAKLSAGGEVTMPLQDTFWGAYFGMWVDKFGIQWMINYDDAEKVQPH